MSDWIWFSNQMDIIYELASTCPSSYCVKVSNCVVKHPLKGGCLTNQCHVSIESNQLQRATPGETHDLGSVEDKAYVVKGLTVRVRIR